MFNSALMTAYVMIGIVMAMDLGITAGGILSGKFMEVNPVYAGSVPSPHSNQWLTIIALGLSKVIISMMTVFSMEGLKKAGDFCGRLGTK
jgi:hypothetical protein